MILEFWKRQIFYIFLLGLKIHLLKLFIILQIFAITCDNASNNDTFMKHLESDCQNKSIFFDAMNNHCRCIAHIMNLAVQDILKQIKSGDAETEDVILDNIDITVTAGEVIPKVIIL